MKDDNVRTKVSSFLIVSIFLVTSALIILTSCLPAAGSKWTNDTDSEFNKGTLDNTKIVGTGTSAKIELVSSTGSVGWNYKSITTKPSSRQDHAMATIDKTDNVLLFGGDDGSNDDETWKYDLSKNTWSKQSPGSKPAARKNHAMAAIAGSDKVVLFGGYGSFIYNDTWVYNATADAWSNVLNVGLNPRYSHAMASIWGQDKVVIFGGNNYNDETWVYDLSDNAWTEKAKTSKPKHREDHAMAAIYGTDKVVMFGGRSINGTEGDTWVFDLSGNSWTKKSPSSKPGAKENHVMATIWGTDKVLLFGGNNNGDETWVYDLSDNTWTKKSPSSKPSARSKVAMASVDNSDAVVLFGGYSNFTYNGQTWVYCNSSASSGSGTYTSTQYDTGANSTFKTLSWDADTTSNTNVKFQLRTSKSKTSLANCNFVGPGGNTTSYYTTSPATIWTGHNGNQWVQYKAYLSSSKMTDALALKKVTITYNNLPNTNPLGPANTSSISDNTPTFTWSYFDLDSEAQAAFQVVISDDISFDTIVYDSGVQSTAGAKWQFPMGTSYTEIADGTWYWKVKAKDQDNDWSDYCTGSEVFIDSKAPTTVITEPVNDKFYSSLDAITGTAADSIPTSGLDKVEITIKRLSDNNYWDGSKWSASVTWLLTSDTNLWSFDTTSISWISGTKYNIQARAIDNVENIEQPGSGVTFTYDSGTPASSIDVPVHNSIVNELDTISGSAIDNGGAGLDTVEICIKQKSDDMHWNGNAWKTQETWLLTAGTTTWSYDATEVKWNTDTYYLIQARATDKLANIEYIGKGNTFLFDNRPPENLVISINDNEKYTTHTDVELSLQAEDSGSGVNQMAFSVDSVDWTDWEEFNSKRSFELSTNDGEKVVYFKTNDIAGNIAEYVYSTIILDTTPPHSLAISINDGAAETDSTTATLSLVAVDDLSGLGSISFSYDGFTWSKWEDFVSLKSFSLQTGDGTKTLYFRAMDKVGNVAEPVYDTILLKTGQDDGDDDDPDGDGFPNEFDAFPNDPAASVDADGDGYPDAWNKGKSGADSTTGLVLDAFPDDPMAHLDSDTDNVPDSIDAFPNDHAAAVDVDNDGYPDEWNPGMTEEQSTTGLKLDPDPTDPNNTIDRAADKGEAEIGTFYIILIVIVTIILISLIITFTIIRNKRARIAASKPYSDDRLLWQLRQEILDGDKTTSSPALSDDDINNILEIRRQRGDISEATYQSLKYYKE